MSPDAAAPGGVERQRMEHAGHLEEGLDSASPWYQWGPYVSERAWGSVREDYSADGDAWSSFPHDHARSRAYRWNEDGMAGISDVFGRLNLGLALWNGKDPILKERMFGLTNSEGNHGEDVKEYWWYLDAVPSSAWLRWRYHYPQAAYPYERLIEENARRSKLEPEFELLDTGIFDDDRYWIVEVHYAKADPTDILARITVRNVGPEAAELHVLPTIWFRNEWSWDPAGARPRLSAEPDGSTILATHPDLGDVRGPRRRRVRTARGRPSCSARTRPTRPGSSGSRRRRRGPRTASTTTSSAVPRPSTPTGRGRRRRAWYRLTVEPGATAEIRLRVRPRPPEIAPREEGTGIDLLGAGVRETMRATREAEADEFYADLRRPGATDDEAMVMRQAFAGMLWSKQFYALRRRPLARRRPGGQSAAARAPDRPQRGLAPLRRRRHPLDARQVGVPVVRRVGPRVPCDHARPRRPGVRQVPAARHVPGVVPAPQRRPAGLRVVVRRRQPARPRPRGARGLEHRRPAGHASSSSGSSTSCCSTSPGG